MSETSNNDFYNEDPEHARHVEDLKVAARQIDPNNWISDSINVYRNRAQEVEMGVTTDYDPTSYDNDSVYKDPELLALQQELSQKYDATLLAVADLHKTVRDIHSREEQLRSIDIRAQVAARKILEADDVTVQDMFPPLH